MSLYRVIFLTAIALAAILIPAGQVMAAPPMTLPGIGLTISPTDEPEGVVATLQILFILTILALAPAIIVLMTSFTRVIVVLSFVRVALATNQVPPNQVIIGLALFITFFIMAPVLENIRVDALEPFLANEITQEAALANAEYHIKGFMLTHTDPRDLALFINASNMEQPEVPQDVSLMALIPAFVISELRTAFIMGFLIFIPFLVIDMVVASTLMSMGMFMIPPIIVSLPFKILLFIMADGWNLIVGSLLRSYGL